MRALVLAFAFLALGAGAAAAQDRYALDPAHTQAAFSIDRFGYNHVIGFFRITDGAVVLDTANPANSSVTASIDVASIAAGDPTREEHLRSERWLNAAAYPTMAFRSTSVRVIDDTHAQVTGDLTIRDQTRPVTLDVTLNRLGPEPARQRQAAGFTATGVISRSAFGINGAANLIGDEVRLTIEALGYAAPPTTPPAQ